MRLFSRTSEALAFSLLACAGFLTYAGALQAQPVAEYADAPDSLPTFYGATGVFPTLFATTNSRVGAPGIHHLNSTQEWLGPQPAVPSVEFDALDPADPDGQTNLIGSDGFDDGLPSLPLTLILTSIPPQAFLTFEVSVGAGAPGGLRFVNVLIDWNRDGEWRSLPMQTPEWAIVNFPVNVGPGGSQVFSAPFPWGLGAQLAPQVFWLRITLTRTPINPAVYAGVGGWDGSGIFAFGETEDYLFLPGVPIRNQGQPAGPGGGGPLGGPAGIGPHCSLRPNSLCLIHGNTGYVCVVCRGGTPNLQIGFKSRVGFGQVPQAVPPKNAPMVLPGVAGGNLAGGTRWNLVAPAAIPAGACPPRTVAAVQILTNEDPPPRFIKHSLGMRFRFPGLASGLMNAFISINHYPFGFDAVPQIQQMMLDEENEELADGTRRAFDKASAALIRLGEEPPRRVPAMADLLAAVRELEELTTGGAVSGLQGAGLMNDLAGVARETAAEAILEAQSAGGRPKQIDRALDAVAEGDALRGNGLSENFSVFAEVVRLYRQAVVQAEASHKG